MGRKLQAYVHVGGRVFEPGSTPPKEFADQITNPKAWADGDGGADSETSYKSMKVDELKAEIEKRNEGRDDADLLSLEGNKADLVAALEADDES